MKTPLGPVRGVQSADPEVVLTVGTKGGAPLHAACCFRCGTAREVPPSPASRGLDGRAVPLLDEGGMDHALHVLTFLHAFSREHAECVTPAKE